MSEYNTSLLKALFKLFSINWNFNLFIPYLTVGLPNLFPYLKKLFN